MPGADLGGPRWVDTTATGPTAGLRAAATKTPRSIAAGNAEPRTRCSPGPGRARNNPPGAHLTRSDRLTLSLLRSPSSRPPHESKAARFHPNGTSTRQRHPVRRAFVPGGGGGGLGERKKCHNLVPALAARTRPTWSRRCSSGPLPL